MSKYTDSVDDCLKGIECASPGISAVCPECQSAWRHNFILTESISDLGDCSLQELLECTDDNETTLEDALFLLWFRHCEPEDEGSFSWSQCDACGSSLGGDRYAAHGFLKGTREIIHLDVCVDCLLYLANGDEPEEWEG